ncbi:hypothetical protein HYV74_02335 [Candidatus Uhrbacteria bacterium]|nr:hypothetical protein [Candidatus Uhrbacteria bacterium]
MLTAHLLRKKKNEDPYDFGGPKQWSLVGTMEFVLRMLTYRGKIMVFDTREIQLQTPIECLDMHTGVDEDRFEGDAQDIRMIAQAIVRWYEIRRRTGDVHEHNAHLALARCPVAAWNIHDPELKAWLTSLAQPNGIDTWTATRIAIMLACGVRSVEVLQSGLAIPHERMDDHGTFLAAFELWLDARDPRMLLTDIVAATAA